MGAQSGAQSLGAAFGRSIGESAGSQLGNRLAGHNGCIECLTSVQQRHPVCPLCRTAFPADVPLQLNLELRELVALAAALNSVSIEDDGNGDGWQTVTSSRPYNWVCSLLRRVRGQSPQDSWVYLNRPAAVPLGRQHTRVQTHTDTHHVKCLSLSFTHIHTHTLHTHSHPRTQQGGSRSDLPGCLQNSDYGRGDDDEYAVPCLPMAPRTMMRTSMSAVQAGQATVLTLDPPTWQPDSSAAGCSRCKAPFG